jgi:hypothetical protein
MTSFQQSNPTSKWLGKAVYFEERYPCPVCRHGEIEGLFMVDAFSCGFCRHVFTIEGLQLRLEDNLQPFRWRWNGDRWMSLREHSLTSLIVAWAIGTAFVLVPTALIWLANYMFPPLPAQSGAGFPVLWTGLVFASHFVIASWLGAEYFQFPLYVRAKLYWQRFVTHLLDA